MFMCELNILTRIIIIITREYSTYFMCELNILTFIIIIIIYIFVNQCYCCGYKLIVISIIGFT